jgi:hypothetical protein
MFIYSYCNVYVFLLLCAFYSVYSVSLCCSVYCFMCKWVMYYSHWVSNQLHLTNISYHIVCHLCSSISSFSALRLENFFHKLNVSNLWDPKQQNIMSLSSFLAEYDDTIREFVRCKWWCLIRFFHLHDYCWDHEDSSKLYRREIVLICGAEFSWMDTG